MAVDLLIYLFTANSWSHPRLATSRDGSGL